MVTKIVNHGDTEDTEGLEKNGLGTVGGFRCLSRGVVTEKGEQAGTERTEKKDLATKRRSEEDLSDLCDSVVDANGREIPASGGG